ncbi:hypothetical protein [Ideonella sp. YS5]|uniref:hypothetical protein n=1 Tax=Ideonella sp. YS5 TaxID=3453714 RepID=UPI003EF031ED
MRELYTRVISPLDGMPRGRSHADCLAALAMAAMLGTAPAAFGQVDPFKPVTADDSCEFGYRVTGPKAWDAPEANGEGEWIDFVLRKAVQYCKDGDHFMIIRSDTNGPMVGWIHDYFSVAALLCRRADIVEEHPLNSRGQERHKFSCPISKIEPLKKRMAEGKLLYKYPDDWVDPRPGDTGAMKRAPGSNEPAYVAPPRPAKPKNDDCKVPKAPHYAERCGLPLVAPGLQR